MQLGTDVGLGPGNIVLDGDPAPPLSSPEKGAEPPPILSPCLLWPNGWMDEDATWYGGRPRPKLDCARWGRSPPPKKQEAQPQFSTHVCYGQTAGWIKIPLGMEVDLGAGHIVLDGDPLPLNRGTAPTFRLMFIVAKRLDGSRCHLV